MLRKLYYLLPPSIRFLGRRIFYLPLDLGASFSNQIMPPKGLIYTGSNDFIKQGLAWKEFFIQYARLQAEDRVLDIGSGIGRIAIPLTNYLTKQYEGFDAINLGVIWCQKNISKKYPHFRFQFFPLYNDLYNSKGTKASEFEFPYAAHTFNFACAISVFTHMVPDEVENYILQMARVMKPNAHAVCTFFVLNEVSIKSMNEYDGFQFKMQASGYHALLDKNVESANVAYDEKWLTSILIKNGFTILYQHQGYWSGIEKTSEIGFQDIWVIKKLDKS